MRYLLPLLFFPSAVFAACAPGVNYGTIHFRSPNPVCFKYSGSTQGGCYAYCEGASSALACIEAPNANPPWRGPYFSNGQECTPSDTNGPYYGPDRPDQGDGTHIGDNGVVDVGTLNVGNASNADISVGFNAIANNLLKTSEKNLKAMDEFKTTFMNESYRNANNYFENMTKDLKTIAFNSGNMGGGGANPVDYEIAGYLKSINDKSVLDPTMWNNNHNQLIGRLDDIRKDMSYMNSWPQQQSYLERILAAIESGGGSGGSGLPETAVMSIYSMDESLSQLKNIFASPQSPYFMALDKLMKGSDQTNQLLGDISGKLDGIGQGGGEGGDKPCEGPLCDFSKPSGSSGSALSKVFSVESIDEVKKQVENKDTEITAAMNDVKSVFAPEQLAISGTYSNDYHDINGARVDLSGKSNMELFFNSGPKMVIWFLAVLIAFSILMGGRKNA